MTDLHLRRASGRRRAAQWPDDFDVIGANGDVVGRIFKATTSPRGKPWAWTRVAGHGEPTHGYALTREAAVQAFATGWHRE